MTLRFFFHYPETTGADADMLDPGPLDEVAVATERSGFSGFSLTEHLVPGARWLSGGGHQSLDPLVALGYAAAGTRRLRLLTNLVVAPYPDGGTFASSGWFNWPGSGWANYAPSLFLAAAGPGDTTKPQVSGP